MLVQGSGESTYSCRWVARAGEDTRAVAALCALEGECGLVAVGGNNGADELLRVGAIDEEVESGLRNGAGGERAEQKCSGEHFCVDVD